MTATEGNDPPSPAPSQPPRTGLGPVASIAAAVATGSMGYNLWSPFLPLFMLDIGAKDEADALFWIAIATTAQGIARLLTGPVWGLLADYVGRKIMLLRTLFLTGIGFMIIAFIQEPWQLIIAFTCQGVFSGFTPAAIALTSVTVPDSQMNKSISFVTGAQYLGNTLGPALGGLFAIALGYRGAVAFAAMLPVLAATWVIFAVPRDAAPGVSRARQGKPEESKPKLEPFRPSVQFGLAIFLYFVMFALTQLIRLVSPIALRDIDQANVETAISLTFTLGGLASAFSLIVLAPRFFRAGNMQPALVMSSALTGVMLLLLSASGTVPLYVLGFALFSLVQAAMIPAANTLIAGNVTRSRRGTAFGIASSAQAIAFMVGPLAAAAFAALSISLGFVILAAILFAVALLFSLFLKEPTLLDEVRRT